MYDPTNIDCFTYLFSPLFLFWVSSKLFWDNTSPPVTFCFAIRFSVSFFINSLLSFLKKLKNSGLLTWSFYSLLTGDFVFFSIFRFYVDLFEFPLKKNFLLSWFPYFLIIGSNKYVETFRLGSSKLIFSWIDLEVLLTVTDTAIICELNFIRFLFSKWQVQLL